MMLAMPAQHCHHGAAVNLLLLLLAGLAGWLAFVATC
jgi:hypothetical protein